ncbi:TIM barrel protein [Mucilaginibacter segetis]|uniref:Sugar isomerase n=1 Tax=Mucilaginibacter segetis TaxID=2793071 RepID=A0A934PQ62_9SPHI|nr:TIM barrel protein [Mucilaginibacter segetis]MBK0378724.1 sugar isomerase [Mucilaginibacter segetis]
MQIEKQIIDEYNHQLAGKHQRNFEHLAADIADIDNVLKKLMAFNVAIPSWALGTGGTRFGRFSGGGEPRSLEEKIADVGVINALNRSSNSISLHIPWDIPDNAASIKSLASELGLHFDAVNSNTFQDQPDQKHSYKFGSLHHVDKEVRKQAIQHNIEVIKYGVQLNSKALSVWLADGSNFPGQLNFRGAFQNTLESLEEIYNELPDDWKIWIEYKPFEPNFYSTTIGDWGQSYLLSSKLGSKAATLVDLGHHLPNTNIEQIVSLLLMEGKLAGFHFNDSKYGDDDLTVGSISPYQLFLIFNELVEGMDARGMTHATDIGWMIDASHNVKDPIEDLLQSVQAIKIAYAQALIIDKQALVNAQQNNDVAIAQEILQQAYRTDVRPLVAEASKRSGGSIDPISLFRKINVREQLIKERGLKTVATGL